MCYHPAVRALFVVALGLASMTPALAADPIAEARRLYNQGQYDLALKMAREALSVAGRSDQARVVLGRIHLERYRQSADPTDLNAARESFRTIDSGMLDSRERVELLIGLAETLYLDERYGAAADLFESVFERSIVLGSAAHERVLDWWATAIDRQAQRRPPDQRAGQYDRILQRMRQEIVSSPGSTAAGYWLAAAARASGHPEEAWHAAIAGWVRAALAEDRGATLRADLDRLVVQAIIPERAAKAAAGRGGDSKTAQASMVSEWDAFKAAWSK
jgi:tetratricopeptide (TPR) repeat protein